MRNTIRTVCFLAVIAVSGLGTAAARNRDRLAVKHGFVTTRDSVRIHYLEAGPGGKTAEASAILFIPGWTMPAEIWEPQIAHFSKTRRVVAMDPRSQGESTQTSEGNYPEARARDIKAVIEELKLAPVVLVGWSMGVTELAAYVDQFGNEGIAGLVLVDGTVGWDIEPEVMREWYGFITPFQEDRSAATVRFVRQMYATPQSPEYLGSITRASLRTPTNTAMALILGAMSKDRRPALAKIRVPTLIIVTRSPYLKMYEDMHSRISGSRFEVLDNVGHALFVDASDKFNSRLGAFLKALPVSAPRGE